jgi:hypothetical protein
MITARNMRKMTAIVLLSGGLGLAALGMGAGTAQADSGPFYWCPGDPMQYPQPAPRSGGQAGPGLSYSWDMNICHTWYWGRARERQRSLPRQPAERRLGRRKSAWS